MVLNLMKFFAQESCGWCTPCRDGTPWAVEILSRIENGQGKIADLDALAQLCDFMWIGKTHCALAPGAVEPLRSALKYFHDDFLQHIEHGCCHYNPSMSAKRTHVAQSHLTQISNAPISPNPQKAGQ